MIPPRGAEFLENPRDIRLAVGDLARRARRMDLAVAFVGQDWRDAIADFRGRLRVVCWLSSTNTNPYAVRQMMRDDRVEVRQRNAMHAKVYVARAIGAVVGSANLSRRALDSADVSGQDEAAVLLRDAVNRSAIGQWFDRLWKAAAPITRGDLDRAVEAYKRARAANRRRFGKKGRGRRGPTPPSFEGLPPGNKAQLRRLANAVRDLDLKVEVPQCKLVAGNPRRMGRARIDQIAEELTEWIGRAFLADRALRRRTLPRVRRGLATLFDESRAPDERLAAVIASGDLAPLKVGTLSVLLYWHNLDLYPPLNWRTRRFLKSFRLLRRGASVASPAAYARWLEVVDDLVQELDLPTRGHVDRMVWRYTPRP